MGTERQPPPGGPDALEAVVCDLCGGEEEDELFPSTIDETAAAHGYYSSSRRRATHGRIVRCRSCGLVRTSPRDSLRTLEEVYRELDDPLYDAETENRAVTARGHLSLVERYARPPGRLLDVGCSTGIFLAAARDRGWDVEGIEASAWAVRRARERFGLTAVQQTALENATLTPASCDAVTMWDVLEHLPSPTLACERIRGWMKPGGCMFMNVPNVDSRMARALRRRWPLLLREHLWYFSPATLEQLLAKCGFRVELIRPNFVTFTLGTVFVRLGQYGDPVAPLWRRLADSGLARRLCLRFPIGEVTVVARRDG